MVDPLHAMGALAQLGIEGPIPLVLNAAALPGGGAVADVVAGGGDALNLVEAHGQQGLGSFVGLDLRLLVDAEHHRLIRRVQV